MATIDKAIQDKVLAALEKTKAIMLADMTKECNMTEWEIAQALPSDMSTTCSGDHFNEIWETIASWEKATFTLLHKGCILKITGTLDVGTNGMGFYNIGAQNGSCVTGHFKVDDLIGIAFISLPFMGSTSKQIAFYAQDGEAKFYVYAGRENKAVIPAIEESFLAMKEKYTNI